MALKDLGLNESDLDKAADLATSKPYLESATGGAPAIRTLLQAAWAGRPTRPLDNRQTTNQSSGRIT
jgi:maleylacetate reductase